MNNELFDELEKVMRIFPINTKVAAELAAQIVSELEEEKRMKDEQK